MTGYNKIKRTKLRRYDGGGDVNYRDTETLGYGQQAGVGNIDTSINGTPTNQNITGQAKVGSSGSGMSASAITTAGNYLGDTVDTFNKEGTGGGSVAMSTASGALKGAAVGAAAGSVVPVIGTAIGAVGGAVIGGVSGYFSGKNKQKAAISDQNSRGYASYNNSLRRSNQVLRQYANNGVEGAQLYATGGPIDPIPPNLRVQVPAFMAGQKDQGVMTDFLKSKAASWGTPVFQGGDEVNGYRWKLNYPAPATNTSRNPTTYQDMGTAGVSLPRNPTPDVVHPSSSYGSGHFAKGGYIKWKSGGRLYDNGGDVDPSTYEAEGGETVQGEGAQVEQSTSLASDMQQINGPSHEQGGVMGQGGERIFSDRLKISSTLKDILKTSGIKVGQNSTYADVSNKLGKLKGKFENKTDGIGKQTASLMLPKIEQSLDDTFNDQEAGKNMRTYKRFAKGGNVKAMQNGEFSIPNVFDGGGPINKLNVQTPAFMSNSQDTPSPIDEQQPSFLPKVGQAINDNSGQITNAGTYLANLGTINKLSTRVSPEYLSTPNYNYVDRSGSALNRNASLLKTGIRGLTNNGNSVNASNIAALFAKTQEGNSYISANENTRKDAYDASYNDRADKTNAENVSIYNKASDDSRDLYNQKVAARLSARNAFQQGIVGNMAVKQSADLEQKKLLTVLAANDQNGVMTRFLKNYPQYKKLLSQYNSTSN